MPKSTIFAKWLKIVNLAILMVFFGGDLNIGYKIALYKYKISFLKGGEKSWHVLLKEVKGLGPQI
jgi:hypothetical protein